MYLQSPDNQTWLISILEGSLAALPQTGTPSTLFLSDGISNAWEITINDIGTFSVTTTTYSDQPTYVELLDQDSNVWQMSVNPSDLSLSLTEIAGHKGLVITEDQSINYIDSASVLLTETMGRLRLEVADNQSTNYRDSILAHPMGVGDLVVGLQDSLVIKDKLSIFTGYFLPTEVVESVSYAVPRTKHPFYLDWIYNNSLIKGYNGMDWVNGSLPFNIAFPGTYSNVEGLYLSTSEAINQTYDELINVKFYLAGTDAHTVQSIWPYYGADPNDPDGIHPKPYLDGGFEVSFDGSRTFTRFDNKHGLFNDPSTWLTLPQSAVGNDGNEGILTAFLPAIMSFRFIIPSQSVQPGTFNIRVEADFDIV